MTKEQENAFWQTIKVFKDIGLLQHVMVIGSWAEYAFRFVKWQVYFE